MPKDLLVRLLTAQILSKVSNFNEVALKSTYFENVYFSVIISYKFWGRLIFSLPEIDFLMIFHL